MYSISLEELQGLVFWYEQVEVQGVVSFHYCFTILFSIKLLYGIILRDFLDGELLGFYNTSTIAE